MRICLCCTHFRIIHWSVNFDNYPSLRSLLISWTSNKFDGVNNVIFRFFLLYDDWFNKTGKKWWQLYRSNQSNLDFGYCSLYWEYQSDSIQIQSSSSEFSQRQSDLKLDLTGWQRRTTKQLRAIIPWVNLVGLHRSLNL